MKRIFILALAMVMTGACAQLIGEDDSSESEIFSAIEQGESTSNALVSYSARGEGERRRPKKGRALRRHFRWYAEKMKMEDPTITSVIGFSLRNPQLPDLDEETEETCNLVATISSNQRLAVAKEPSHVSADPAVLSEDAMSIDVEREARGMKIVFTVHGETEVPALSISGSIVCGDETLSVEHDLAAYLTNEEPGFRFVESFGSAMLRGLGANFAPGDAEEDDIFSEL